ncbi:hypothetical protein niasHT_038560 [Heterodera trifolii]|uniref:Uncharacterized protein n=1 Tax=Heterodera trifolii TaxID=157864 RepID=A0ABD2I309_9BILA
MGRAHLPEDPQPRPRPWRCPTQTKRAGTSGFFVQLDELYKTISMASGCVYYKWRKLSRKLIELYKKAAGTGTLSLGWTSPGSPKDVRKPVLPAYDQFEHHNPKLRHVQTKSNGQSVDENDICAPDICAPDICAPDICAPDICAPDICAPDICVPDICAPNICAQDICAYAKNRVQI